MKPENKSASQPVHPPIRHQFEHEVPTVIHNPEEDMTALGRWFHHAYQDPNRFWGWTIALFLGVIAAVVLANYLSGTRSTSSDIWTRLEETKKAADKVEIAKEYPSSPATSWALLQAATEYYQDGFGDLPSNRDAALPALKKALDLFDQVAKEAPKDSPLARHATLGKARTYEARNELPKAIEEYKLVSKNWPGTMEAKMAESLAKSLETPDAAAFYKELYAYQPTKVTLPPEGQATLPGLTLDPSSGGAFTVNPSSSTPSSSSFPLLPPPPPLTKPVGTPATKPEPKTESKSQEPTTPKSTASDASKDKAASQSPATKPEPKAEAKPAAPAEGPKGGTPTTKP